MDAIGGDQNICYPEFSLQFWNFCYTVIGIFAVCNKHLKTSADAAFFASSFVLTRVVEPTRYFLQNVP